jgi:1,2-diacylglycerol 3-beta-glucosyltransferase
MLIDGALLVLSVPVLGCTTYLAALAALSCGNSPARTATVAAPKTRFDVVVPAHDEERGIAATVTNLLAMDYPAELRRIIVVADNCSDATAARAAEAGALVFERHDELRRGKGYALAFAFERVLRGDADAVVVIDADTRATANLLRAFDARLQAGAPAVQAHYGVLNPEAAWRTRLMHIGFTLFHDVRSRARERLGVSTGLRGNGMAFAAATLREVPHDAYSIVEDVEYGIQLALRGHRVEYAGEAQVLGEMVSSEKASRSQRRRWEGGRWLLARRHAASLFAEGFRRRSLLLLDLAADLLVPPLSYVVVFTLGGLTASAIWAALGGSLWPLAAWSVAGLGLTVYVARGLWLSRVGARGLLDLLWAPVYIAWKLALAIQSPPSGQREWVRTTREGSER